MDDSTVDARSIKSSFRVGDETNHGWSIAGTWVVLVGLLFGFAQVILQKDTDARRALADRFETRAAMTASFIEEFVDDIADRERSQAERLLGDMDVDQVAFESVVASFDFQAAVLLDQDGRLLQVWPAKPELIGRDMTADYTHLRTAVAGGTGVSEVVMSAAVGLPVTAVAVPFESAAGRRVFSGAFPPSMTPLGPYLDSVVPVAGGTAYLIDDSGNFAGRNSPVDDQTFDELPLGISEFDGRTGEWTAAVADVPNTPWRVVLVAPSAGLYSPTTGDEWAAWALWLTVAVSGSCGIGLFMRLGRARADSAAMARTDALTGISNRRAMQEALNNTAWLTSRDQTPLAALMIDIDHFKKINDDHGHDAGDIAIRAVAQSLVDAIRTGDKVGRWGGEEFLVLLPHADQAAAREVAERIRNRILATVHSNGSASAPVTVSVGIAILGQADTVALLRHADAALYAAKASGRNRVEVYRDVAATAA